MTKNRKNSTDFYWLSRFVRKFGFNTDGDRYRNPIRKTSIAMFSLDALEDLGKNEWHDLDSVCNRIKEIMQSVNKMDYLTCWDAFYINTDTNVMDRLKRSIMSLQNRYGRKLQKVGARVDIKETDKTHYLRLNTKNMATSKELLIVKKANKSSFLMKVHNYIKSIFTLIRWS